MQNSAVYNSAFNTVVVTPSAANTPWMPRAARCVRTLARKWDLIGVLSLMTSSAAYGIYALAHTGL